MSKLISFSINQFVSKNQTEFCGKQLAAMRHEPEVYIHITGKMNKDDRVLFLALELATPING